MTAKERIEAIQAITEFMQCNPYIDDATRGKCIDKIMELISLL